MVCWAEVWVESTLEVKLLARGLEEGGGERAESLHCEMRSGECDIDLGLHIDELSKCIVRFDVMSSYIEESLGQ